MERILCNGGRGSARPSRPPLSGKGDVRCDERPKMTRLCRDDPQTHGHASYAPHPGGKPEFAYFPSYCTEVVIASVRGMFVPAMKRVRSSFEITAPPT